MRILLFQTESFSYQAQQTGSPEAVPLGQAQSLDQASVSTPEPVAAQADIHGAAIAFIHMEAEDEQRAAGLLAQAIKYFRWYSRKRECRHLVLHSFAHLDEARASAAFSKVFLNDLEQALKQHELEVQQTPFGWSLAWEMKVLGHAYAKTFKRL